MESWRVLVFAGTKMGFGVSRNANGILEETIGISTIHASQFQYRRKKGKMMTVNPDVLPSMGQGDAQYGKASRW